MRGKRSLEDSLDFYVQSELMEGENQYLCEEAGQKVSAQGLQCPLCVVPTAHLPTCLQTSGALAQAHG